MVLLQRLRKENGEWGGVMENFKIYEMSEEMPIYFVDRKNVAHLISGDDTAGAWMKKSGEKDDPGAPPGRTLVIISRVRRDNSRSYQLKNDYKNRCQICGETIQLAGVRYSEVHHLKPLGKHNGKDSKSNMIVVCPNHHVQLDYGAIAINPATFKVITFEGDEIGSFFILENHTIDKEFLEYQFKISKCN